MDLVDLTARVQDAERMPPGAAAAAARVEFSTATPSVSLAEPGACPLRGTQIRLAWEPGVFRLMKPVGRGVQGGGQGGAQACFQTQLARPLPVTFPHSRCPVSREARGGR